MRSIETMDEATFVDLYGGVYEHSDWVARAAWQQGVSDFSVDAVAAVLAAQVNMASKQRQLQLINEHPDLAGKAAVRGELTAESAAEQSSAGIDQCSEQELARFEILNNDYKDKFGFPFIMAVKGSNRFAILDGFSRRIANDYDTEFATALEEIHKIARFRLEEIGGYSLRTGREGRS